MSKFRKKFEEKANDIADSPQKELWENTIPAMIRREIALTVDKIKRLREQHDNQFRRLLKIECYIDTDLMQLEQRQPRYIPYHFPEKEKLKQRLFDIEKERRNLSMKLEEKTQGLEEKLLNLINKCKLVDV